MQLLWIILRALFPTDPVQQCIAAARQRVALMVSKVFSPESLYLLAHDPRARLHIEALVIDYEAALHFAIGARACQIAKLRFRQQPRAFFKPTRALSTERLLARIRGLVKMCGAIERLARIRAGRLLRERDADPLAPYAPPSHRSSRRTPGSRADIEACSRLQLQACVRLAVVPGSRHSPGRAGLSSAHANISPRGPPPLPIVAIHPEAALQLHLRGRRRMCRRRLRRPWCPRFPFIRAGSRQTSPNQGPGLEYTGCHVPAWGPRLAAVPLLRKSACAERRGASMTQSPKPRTAAQRASDANHDKQMVENVRDGRKTPPPRDPEAGRKAYEDRHGGSSHRR